MRPVLVFCVLICLTFAGFGVHLVLEQQERVLAFSGRTTAIVLNKQLKRIERRQGVRRPGVRQSRFLYEPIVKFRFAVQGREFTNDDVFPEAFRVGGNLGHLAARALLDRFQIGEKTKAYYKPDNPAEACLIRRPSILFYLVVLLPMIVVSGTLPFVWRSPRLEDIELKRRKGCWIAALWYLVGLAVGGHYFYLAGADYAGGALALFGIYAQLGLIPLAFALPRSRSSKFARRVKGVIGFSFVGTFVGLFLGLLFGALAQFFAASPTGFFLCWGYTIAMTTAVFTGLALIGRAEATGEFESRSVRDSQPEPAPEPDVLAPTSAPGGVIPYHIDERPMPSGEDFESLLPGEVGPFHRESMEVPGDLSKSSIYAQYRSDRGEIFVELGICGDPASAQRALRTAKEETDAEFPDARQQLSLNTEPSFLKTNTRRGAFMAWTRGGYYFSAHAHEGEKDLDQFVEAFPF